MYSCVGVWLVCVENRGHGYECEHMKEFGIGSISERAQIGYILVLAYIRRSAEKII